MTQNKDKPSQQEIRKKVFVDFLTRKADELFDTNFHGKFIVEFRAGKVAIIRMSDVIITVDELMAEYREIEKAKITIPHQPYPNQA